MKKWKKVDSKLLLNHSRLSVYEDRVILSSGNETNYLHFGKAKNGAMIIAVNAEGKILVQKEYSYPPNDWLYQFPGGALEPGETPTQAARRELAEEASLAGTLEQIGWFYTDNRRQKNKQYVFAAKNLKKSVGKKDKEEEFIEYWLSVNEIKALIRNGEIVNSTALAGWTIFAEASP